MSTQMTLFCVTVHGKQNNNYYPNSAVITTAADLKAAAVWDHVAAGYTGGYRANKNFVTSDCVVMDVDNDHTDNPDEWVSPEDLPALIREWQSQQRLKAWTPERRKAWSEYQKAQWAKKRAVATVDGEVA